MRFAATATINDTNLKVYDFLVVGGGGGGGAAPFNKNIGGAAGGGAGGFMANSFTTSNLTGSYFSIVVGQGGSGYAENSAGIITSNATSGLSSSLYVSGAFGNFNILCEGGGLGGYYGQDGSNGGSGGGGGFQSNIEGTGSLYGNNGGDSNINGPGGGGGALFAGGIAANYGGLNRAGEGGQGKSWVDGGRYAGGGGGGNVNTGYRGGTATDGGGAGALFSGYDGGGGVDYTGGGGGALGQYPLSGFSYFSGAGGKGVVKLRYQATSSLFNVGTIQISGSFVYHTFTSSVNFTV